LTPFQIVLTFAYLGGIGFLLIGGYRLIFRFARPEEATTRAQTPARKDVGSTGTIKVGDSSTPDREKNERTGRPRGLVILAYFHFFAAAGAALQLLAGGTTILTGTIANLIIIPLLLLTGYGFLHQSWTLGFIGGNAYAIFVLATSVVNRVIILGVASLPSFLPFLFYPFLLLLLINLTYKPDFLANRSSPVNPQASTPAL
jgi:hypothetical protein